MQPKFFHSFENIPFPILTTLMLVTPRMLSVSYIISSDTATLSSPSSFIRNQFPLGSGSRLMMKWTMKMASKLAVTEDLTRGDQANHMKWAS